MALQTYMIGNVSSKFVSMAVAFNFPDTSKDFLPYFSTDFTFTGPEGEEVQIKTVEEILKISVNRKAGSP